MNNLSDHAAHLRDEQHDNSPAAERLWARLPRCPIHHVPLIAARGFVGLDGFSHTTVFATPACPECLRQDARRLADLEGRCDV